MRVLSIVGARPQFVKLGPVAEALAVQGHQHEVLHTGQHYDDDMSAVFFRQLSLPEPTMTLDVGSGPHGAQTAAMLTGIERRLLVDRPDWVVVYGDTNSTLAGALAAVKLHVPVAHVEAGLRSQDRRMPEEHNRTLTDHASDLLLAPTATAMEHLAVEGLRDRAVLVGDVMVDALRRIRDVALGRPAPLSFPGAYVVATVHRASNTDDPDRLAQVMAALAALPLPVALLAHPRLRQRAEQFGVRLDEGALTVLPPLPYVELVGALTRARALVTDSGGMQKEAYLLEVPCTTLRAQTEWPETLDAGWNVLVPDLEGLPSAVERSRPTTVPGTPFGAGDAGRRVVAALEEQCS